MEEQQYYTYLFSKRVAKETAGRYDCAVAYERSNKAAQGWYVVSSERLEYLQTTIPLSDEEREDISELMNQ